MRPRARYGASRRPRFQEADHEHVRTDRLARVRVGHRRDGPGAGQCALYPDGLALSEAGAGPRPAVEPERDRPGADAGAARWRSHDRKRGHRHAPARCGAGCRPGAAARQRRTGALLEHAGAPGGGRVCHLHLRRRSGQVDLAGRCGRTAAHARARPARAAVAGDRTRGWRAARAGPPFQRAGPVCRGHDALAAGAAMVSERLSQAGGGGRRAAEESNVAQVLRRHFDPPLE